MAPVWKISDFAAQTLLHKSMQFRMLSHERPVEPAGFIVLALSIVVAVLTASHFVTHENHWDAQGKHCDSKKILRLPVAQLFRFSTAG